MVPLPRYIIPNACKGTFFSYKRSVRPTADRLVTEYCRQCSPQMRDSCYLVRTTATFESGSPTRLKNSASSPRENARRSNIAIPSKSDGRWTRRSEKCSGAFANHLYPSCDLFLFRSLIQEPPHPEAGLQGCGPQAHDAGGSACQGGAQTEAHSGRGQQAKGREEEGCHRGANMSLSACIILSVRACLHYPSGRETAYILFQRTNRSARSRFTV